MSSRITAPLLPVAALARLAAVISICMAFCGCSLAYKNSLRRDGFVVYTNDGPEFLQRTGVRIERIYTCLSEVFEIPRPFPWTTRIFLDGQADGLFDYSYNPDLLGYYVPFLQMIRIDSRAAASNLVSDLDQVLLPEIVHHFLVSELPGISGKCWLNEGLAGNLEVGIIDEKRAEFPLLNPVLLKIARRELAGNKDRNLLRDLLRSDWKSFHDEKTREKNYALSWAIVYHLLEAELPAELPLKARINRIHAMDEETITALESRWRNNILKLEVVEKLGELARESAPGKRLTALWAIHELGKSRGFNVRHSLATLAKLFDDEASELREAAYVAFLELLSNNPQMPFLDPEKTGAALARLQSVIADRGANPRLRARLVENLDHHRTLKKDWIPLLIETLEDSRPMVRAAAAGALSKMAAKPTIVSPLFWTNASIEERSVEVGEWKRWLAARGSR